MNFNKKDLLNVKEITELIVSEYSHDKALIICDKLIKYCFVFNEKFYELQPNMTYVEKKEVKLSLQNKVSYLIQQSHKNLDEKDSENIELRHKKYNTIFTNSNIETYYPQVLAKITKTEVEFNVTIGEIHYNNGYMDVATKTFKMRTFGSHLITKYINRNYVASTVEERNSVYRHVCKVYATPADLTAILFYFGSALSWKGTQDQLSLFLLGLGSTGKSFIMELTKATLTKAYFLELASDTFATGSTGNINKILNSYMYDPQILVSWVNEPKDKKMDGSLFKVWTDGNLQSTMLYKDTQFNFTHHSKCVTTANTMPQIIVESGTVRRLLGLTHLSTFTDDETKLDASKNVFLLDKDIISKMGKENLLNAWFDILVDYCYKWLKGEKPVYGDNFKETKEAIISSSDIFQDFIDAKLMITTNEKDKIGKDEMKKEFLDMYPDKHLTTIQVITSLKERKILYNTNLRYVDNVRGCYYNVRFKTDRDIEKEDKNDKSDPYEAGINKIDQSIPNVTNDEYVRLKEIEKLYNELLKKTTVNPFIKKVDKVKERKEIVESMIKQMKPKKKTKPVEIVIEKEIVIIPPKLYLGLTREQALELSDEQFVNMYKLYKHNEDKDRLFEEIERNLPYLKMCHKQIKEEKEAIKHQKPKPVNMMMKPKKIEKTVVVKEVEEVELITKEDVEEAFSGSSFFSFSD